MTTLEKKLRALSSGKELPWREVVSLLEAFGALVHAPNGGGSHYKVVYPGKETIIIPVHNGKIKKVYASKLAKLLESINDKE